MAEDSDSFYSALFSVGLTGAQALAAWEEYQRLRSLKAVLRGKDAEAR
jgi:hypothetical protein